MEVKELRIGNLVQNSNGIFEISTLITDITLVCKPILLTEEWMVKFGFKKQENFWGDADRYQGMYSWELDDNICLFQQNFKNEIKLLGYSNTKIEYVHQLQNLYYALTNKELTIKQ